MQCRLNRQHNHNRTSHLKHKHGFQHAWTHVKFIQTIQMRKTKEIWMKQHFDSILFLFYFQHSIRFKLDDWLWNFYQNFNINQCFGCIFYTWNLRFRLLKFKTLKSFKSLNINLIFHTKCLKLNHRLGSKRIKQQIFIFKYFWYVYIIWIPMSNLVSNWKFSAPWFEFKVLNFEV